MDTYLIAAGHDEQRAARLYIWNAKIGESFHIPIQAVEVGLRNRINHALKNKYGDDWWKEKAFISLADQERKADLAIVLKRIRNRKLDECNSQVVAGLSFGFWVGMLAPRYNPEIWSAHLKASFPHLPDTRKRKSLAASAGQIATLRNRIAHHEPLIKRDLSSDYQRVMTMIEWICPTKLAWIKPHCRVPSLLRTKP